MNLPQSELIHHIIDAACALGEHERANTQVEYNSAANQLRVTVKPQWAEPPAIDECIELHRPTDSEFSKRRALNRLTEIANKLDSMLFQFPRPAA